MSDSETTKAVFMPGLVPGKIAMDAPAVSPEQAVANFDELVREWSCNRQTRMVLEQSVRVLRKLVEDAAEYHANARSAKFCDQCSEPVLDGVCTGCGHLPFG